MNKLFDEYKAAFDQFDAEAICRCYQLPCAISDGDGESVFDSPEALLDKFQNNCATMEKIGYQSSTYHIESQQPMGDNACAVTIQWNVVTAQQTINFYSLYICHKMKNANTKDVNTEAWKIFTANVY